MVGSMQAKQNGRRRGHFWCSLTEALKTWLKVTKMEENLMKRPQLFVLLLASVLLVPLSALAENSTSVGGFTIHYNAFTTSTLTPEVAKAYGIQRSKYRGMLNVSVIKDEEGAIGTSVPALVNAKILVLTGQQSSRLPMREITEQDAVYYVGEFPVLNEERVRFIIEVTPQGSSDSIVINMEQQFFTD